MTKVGFDILGQSQNPSDAIKPLGFQLSMVLGLVELSLLSETAPIIPL